MSYGLDMPTELVDAITDTIKRRGGVWKVSRGDWRFRCLNPEQHENGDAHTSADWNPGKAVWKCRVCGDGGGAYELARRLGIDTERYGPRFELNGKHGAPTAPAPTTLAGFCTERHLPIALLNDVFEVRETTHDGRPALRYPTARGDRIRFLDDKKPKYKFATSGHETLYNVGRALDLLRAGQTTLYLVNGEPSVWACHAEGVPACCLCIGEKAPSIEAVDALREVLAGLPTPVRVVVAFDRDTVGQQAAMQAVAVLRAGQLTATAITLPESLPPKGDVDDLHRLVDAQLGDVLAELVPSEPRAAEPDDAQAERVATAWRGVIADTELFPAPAPYWIERLLQHVQPFMVMFDDPAFDDLKANDWATMMVLPFWASLWPRLRLQNLNLALWTLGISRQSVGKNVGTDELRLVSGQVLGRVSEQRVTLYTTGTVEGMWDKLGGIGRQMLCYQAEFGGFLQTLKRDHMHGAREALCDLYDGRSVGYLRSQQKDVEVIDPHVVVCATTTPTAWKSHASIDDLSNGYLSRFLMCAPDYWERTPEFYPSDDHRRRTLIEELALHVGQLRDVRSLAWHETQSRKDPQVLDDYRAHLGLGSGRKINLDDDLSEPLVPGGRLLARAKKIAGLLELAEPAPHLSDDKLTIYVRSGHAESAVQIVERGRAYAERVAQWIGESSDYGLSRKVLDLVRATPGGITTRNLCWRSHAKSMDVQSALKLLAGAGLVAPLKVGRAEKWIVVDGR